MTDKSPISDTALNQALSKWTTHNTPPRELSAFVDGFAAALSAAPDAPTDADIMREARAYFDVTQEPDRKPMYSGAEEVVIAVVRASMGYRGDAQREQDRLDAERLIFEYVTSLLANDLNASKKATSSMVDYLADRGHLTAAIAQAKEANE